MPFPVMFFPDSLRKCDLAPRNPKHIPTRSATNSPIVIVTIQLTVLFRSASFIPCSFPPRSISGWDYGARNCCRILRTQGACKQYHDPLSSQANNSPFVSCLSCVPLSLASIAHLDGDNPPKQRETVRQHRFAARFRRLRNSSSQLDRPTLSGPKPRTIRLACHSYPNR